MTHDELIEATAQTICQEQGIDPDSTYDGMPMWRAFIVCARAAIRVIAPVVLEDVDRELAMTCLANSEAPSEWIDGFEAAGQRVRAMKTRYEQ